MFQRPYPGAAFMVIAMLAALAPACTTVRETQPPRTATEQFLISHAAMSSIELTDFGPLKGRRVYIDTTYFEAYDQKFVVGQTRAALKRAGVILAKLEDADVIVELRSAGLSVNKKDSVVGLPALPVPIPGTGTFTTPEIAILKEQDHKGLAGVAILALERDDNSLVTVSEPAVGLSRLHKISILGIPIIEERQNLPRQVQE